MRNLILQNKFIRMKLQNRIEILLQLILCCIILSIIHINFNYFGWTWQHTTPGFIFVSFFFGAQYNVFTNMQKRFIIDRK